jgi:hypothetical protein
MGRTAETGVVNPIPCSTRLRIPSLTLSPLYVVLCYVCYGPVHGEVVMTGGNDEVHIGYESVAIYGIIMDKWYPLALRSFPRP